MMVKDMWGARRGVVNVWKRVVAGIRGSEQIEKVETRVQQVEDSLVGLAVEIVDAAAKADSAIAALEEFRAAQVDLPKRRKKLMVHGIAWSAPEVPSVCDENIAFCPICDQRGQDTPLELVANTPSERARADDIGALLAQINPPDYFTFRCTHGTAHPMQRFETVITKNEYWKAAKSQEIRDRTKLT